MNKKKFSFIIFNIVILFFNVTLGAAATFRDEKEDKQIFSCGHYGHVTTVAFSPNDRFVAAGFYYGEVVVWNMLTHEHWELIAPKQEIIQSIVFRPEDNAVFASCRNALAGWKLLAGGKSDRFYEYSTEFPFGNGSVVIHPGGALVAFREGTDTIKIVDLLTRNGKYKIRPAIKSECYANLCFSCNGKFLIEQDIKGKTCIFDMDKVKAGDFEWPTQENLRSVAISSNGRVIAACSGGGMVKIKNSVAGKYYSYDLKNCKAICLSPDGNTLAVSTECGRLVLINMLDPVYANGLDLNKGRGRLQKILHYVDWANVITFNHSGTKIAAGMSDGSIIVLDKNQPQKEKILTLACACHPRLGAPSSAKYLSQSDLMLIFDMLNELNKQ